jgi:hypothetical protein
MLYKQQKKRIAANFRSADEDNNSKRDYMILPFKVGDK